MELASANRAYVAAASLPSMRAVASPHAARGPYCSGLNREALRRCLKRDLRFGPLFLALAVLVAFPRLYVGAPYAIDVPAGMIIGLIIAAAGARRCRRA